VTVHFHFGESGGVRRVPTTTGSNFPTMSFQVFYERARPTFNKENRDLVSSLFQLPLHILCNLKMAPKLSHKLIKGMCRPLSCDTALHTSPELVVRAYTPLDGWFREINSQWPGMFS
jgi:hypothetical protein